MKCVANMRKSTFKQLEIPYEEYLQTDHWKQVRNKRMEMDSHKCVICGATDDLQVHHCSYERLWNENVDVDLMTLCKPCHKRIHAIKDREEHSIKQNYAAWEKEAAQAIAEIANKYRTNDGEHLAKIVYEIIGDKSPKGMNINAFVSKMRDTMQFEAGYSYVYPLFAKTSSFESATKKLAEIRRKKGK